MRTERNEGDKSVPAFCDSFGVDDRGERERGTGASGQKLLPPLTALRHFVRYLRIDSHLSLSFFFILALSLFLSPFMPRKQSS